MKKRKIMLFVAKCALFAGWFGLLAIYIAVSKEMLPLLIVGLITAVSGFVCSLTLFLVASFPDKKTKAEWFSYLFIESSDDTTDYAAELKKTRADFLNDGDPLKNTFLKPHYANAKPFCDFSTICTGKIFYGCLVLANENLFKYSRFVHKVLPAVVLYSVDDYFESNPEELIKIADLLEKNREGVLKNQTKYFKNVKLSDEVAGDREIYMSTVLICKRQLPFGQLFNYRLFPVIAAPHTDLPVFAVDSKYWSDKLIYNFIRYEYGNADYGEPFDI